MTMTSPTSSSSPFDLAALAVRKEHIEERIAAAGRSLESVTIVAVTKTYGPDAVRAALALGYRHVGENYVDELERTRAGLDGEGATWHFQGALQRNKLARLLEVADVIDSVSRSAEIRDLARRRPGARCKIQVDFTGRAERNGCQPSETASLVALARDEGLALEGLMTVAAPDPQLAKDAFLSLARMADDLDLPARSMGMSTDFELALAAGSTEIRLGTALFGTRGSVAGHR
jgi:pyridoxal phosphate enzyme (YggS family)